MANIYITSDYAGVLMVACLIGFLVIIEGFGVASIRRALFTKQFFDKHFPGKFKGNYPESGYPDMGSGQYSQKLSLEDWTTFNNAQRVHYNFLEQVCSVLVFLLTSGIFYPKLAVYGGLAYFVGRVVYGRGYKIAGSKGRLAGVLVLDLAFLFLLGLALYGCFNAVGGVNGIVKLLTK
eukprot:TRINITY_DN894_c0_g1_i1.p1 TRINITY_DN894_c0_g1~~TRINITY_DN894_c0_g1_i1.p1  ORF type:complete len:178 (-),score=34.34 TRINITY_DN894_c0_g1_i1:46-579(-)